MTLNPLFCRGFFMSVKLVYEIAVLTLHSHNEKDPPHIFNDRS